jgi:uncharacterized repeat protein (TIGR01451 family)
MFEKLISLLPYNPGMVQQLAFYGRRMKQEAGIRRTGLIFIVLSFMVQFFAVIAPPQVTSAASNNDLINGGFNSASEAAKDCNNNVEDYSVILKNYGVSCSEVSNASVVSIKSTADNKTLYSMGRLPYGLAGETPVNISGATYYVRYLWAWDTTSTASTYQALKVTAQNGTVYYLLYACGNLVSVGLPKPVETGGSAGVTIVQPVQSTPAPTPKPKLSIIKSMSPGYPAAGSQVTPGTTLQYKVEIDNSGDAATDVDLSDLVPTGTTYSFMSLNDGATSHTYSSSTRTAEWKWATIPQETGNYVVLLRTVINSNDVNGQQICNEAVGTASNSSAVSSNQVCVTVSVPNAPQTCADTTATNYGAALPCTYPATQTTCQDTTASNYGRTLPCTYPTTTTTPTPCTYDTSIAAASSDCKPCEASVSSDDTVACITVHKTATNLTQGLADANGTTANPGDTILYTLYADNTGKGDVNDYVFQEDLSDVMDYADPVDLHGGTIDNNDQVTWASQTISAGQTATEQITVKVKDPIPTTPQDPGDPSHFDHVMTNVYGNTININVPTAPVTAVETASTTLPNTGPGTSIFIAAAIVVISAFFYSRARLLAKESAMAVQENSGGLN